MRQHRLMTVTETPENASLLGLQNKLQATSGVSGGKEVILNIVTILEYSGIPVVDIWNLTPHVLAICTHYQEELASTILYKQALVQIQFPDDEAFSTGLKSKENKKSYKVLTTTTPAKLLRLIAKKFNLKSTRKYTLCTMEGIALSNNRPLAAFGLGNLYQYGQYRLETKENAKRMGDITKLTSLRRRSSRPEAPQKSSTTRLKRRLSRSLSYNVLKNRAKINSNRIDFKDNESPIQEERSRDSRDAENVVVLFIFQNLGNEPFKRIQLHAGSMVQTVQEKLVRTMHLKADASEIVLHTLENQLLATDQKLKKYGLGVKFFKWQLVVAKKNPTRVFKPIPLHDYTWIYVKEATFDQKEAVEIITSIAARDNNNEPHPKQRKAKSFRSKKQNSKDVERLKQHLEQLQQEIVSKESKLKEFEEVKTKVEQSRTELEKKNRKLRGKLKKAHTTISLLENNIEASSESDHDPRHTRASGDDYTIENLELKSMIEQSQLEVKDLRAKIQGTKRYYTNLIDSLQQNIDEQDDTREQLATIKKQSEGEIQRLQLAEQEARIALKESEMAREAQQNTIKQLLKKISVSKQTEHNKRPDGNTAKLNKKIKQLKSENKELKHSVQFLRWEKEYLEKRLSNSTNETKAVESLSDCEDISSRSDLKFMPKAVMVARNGATGPKSHPQSAFSVTKETKRQSTHETEYSDLFSALVNRYSHFRKASNMAEELDEDDDAEEVSELESLSNESM